MCPSDARLARALSFSVCMQYDSEEEDDAPQAQQPPAERRHNRDSEALQDFAGSALVVQRSLNFFPFDERRAHDAGGTTEHVHQNGSAECPCLSAFPPGVPTTYPQEG